MFDLDDIGSLISPDDLTVPPVPADPRDIMAALLRTLPPPVGDKSTRKVSKQKRKGGK
jgi:hypothetical protein